MNVVGATPLVCFLRHPRFADHPPGQLTPWRWLGWLCLIVVVDFAAAGLTRGIGFGLGWKVPAHSFLGELGTILSIPVLLIVLIEPVLEELGFRAFLSTNPKMVFVGLAFFLVDVLILVGNIVLPELTHVRSATHASFARTDDYYFAMYLPLVLTAPVSYILYRRARAPIMRLFREHGPWIFWLSCIVFGGIHEMAIMNRLVWWGFLMALPQFLAGMTLAYLRVNFGLKWSIAAHLALDWAVVFGVAAIHSAPAHSALRGGVTAVSAVVMIFVAIYGIRVLVRVARRQW